MCFCPDFDDFFLAHVSNDSKKTKFLKEEGGRDLHVFSRNSPKTSMVINNLINYIT